MASLHVLTFDHEGRPIQFDTWLDDLQLYLLSDSRDSVSLFDHTSGAYLAPPATADSATRSQWLTRDAAARLAIRNHLPLAECAHFGQHKTAIALYDAVVARYSSPATAALGRLLLPYLFPELSAFATVEDLVTHLCTSDSRYRAAVPAHGAAGAGDSATRGTRVGGARATSLGGAGVPAGAGGPGGAGAAGLGGARTRGTGAAEAHGAGGAGAGDPGAGGAGAGGTGASGPGGTAGGAAGGGAGGAGAGAARGTGAAGPGAARIGGTGAAGAGGTAGVGAGGTGAGAVGGPGAASAAGVGAGDSGAGGTSPWGLTPPLLCPPPDQSQPPQLPASPQPAPSPYTEQTGGLTEHREPVSRPALPVRAVCIGPRFPRPRPPPVPGTHHMALLPSSVPQRVPLPSPPASSLADGPDPESDLVCAAILYVDNKAMIALCQEHRLEHRTKHIALRYFLARELQQRGQLRLAYVATRANTANIFTKALKSVAELVDFAAACRLNYAASLAAESGSVCPPSGGGECALSTDILQLHVAAAVLATCKQQQRKQRSGTNEY
ncbi:unnamed protein product [Closterium sp. NIES-53]